jgi:hypothetical protein
MKSNLTTHPHTATPQIYKQTDGRLFCMIEVEISVPSRVAAMLAERGGAHIIPSAAILDAADVGKRARNWKSSRRRGAKQTPPLVSLLAKAAAEGCDTPINIEIPPEGWHLVGMLCGKLGITPGQWLVACSTYNADHEESLIESQLAGIAGEMMPP